jgi:A/G-specific adenine glycosylase
MRRSSISGLQASVLNWYEANGRQLPWRSSRDPYRIWISEIMLQQTTVAAVVPYFERFLRRFPNLSELASAPEDDVLRLWEGLGYYSRARNLHRTAIQIVQQHQGVFPRHLDDLRALPGIGRYTAGAIASFAFNQPAAIVEANTERLYARLCGIDDDIRKSSSQKRLWDFAESIVPQEHPGTFNQALMDLGASICRPADPQCDSCPVSRYCTSFRLGKQHQIPVRGKRTAITKVSELAVVLQRKKEFLLRRRTEPERWAGLWDFVRFEINDEMANTLTGNTGLRRPWRHRQAPVSGQQKLFDDIVPALPDELTSHVRNLTGYGINGLIDLTEFHYSVTRYRVRLVCGLSAASGRKMTATEDYQWFRMQDMETLPLSRTGRMISEWLKSRSG